MNPFSPEDELTRRRGLVESLQAGAKIMRDGVDITADEIRVLKLEIALLEKTLTTVDETERPEHEKDQATGWPPSR